MQNTAKRSASHVYDYVVVGSGLSGLIMARALNRITDNVLLLEAQDEFGGLNHSVGWQNQEIPNGLRFLPDTELARRGLQFLQVVSGQTMQILSLDCAPLTFETGSLRPFVGFGENPPAFYDELAYFLAPQRLQMDRSPAQWIRDLAEGYTGDFQSRAYVTKYMAAEARLESVMINGQRSLRGQNFVHAGRVQDLQVLLPDSVLNARARQRLTKAKYWTAICLDLVHSEVVSDSLHTHLLNGTTDDEMGPCVGQFLVPTASATAPQISQWVSFVDHEDAQESENIANTLKKMKRQIKRASPQAMEKIAFERILIAPSIGGNGGLQLTGHQTLAGLENFWLSSSALHQQKNLLGCLLQAELVCSAMACHPDESLARPLVDAEVEISAL